MRPNEVSQLITLMNPDDRIFFGRFRTASFINQRLIGFRPKNQTEDIELCHALMNSVIMKFFIEAVGFGRGLGVLDINKKNVADCLMLNPRMLSESAAFNIKSKFRKICEKPIMNIEDELVDQDWIAYNKLILEAYQISSYYEKITSSLMSLRKVRKTARKGSSRDENLNLNTIFSEYNDLEDRMVADLDLNKTRKL